jgi:hypothetical protein
MAAVAIHVQETEILVETLNTSSDSNAATVRQAISDLADAGDLKQMFVDRLLNSTASSGQLGLIKIAMETNGTLSLVPHQDAMLIHIKLSMQTE